MSSNVILTIAGPGDEDKLAVMIASWVSTKPTQTELCVVHHPNLDIARLMGLPVRLVGATTEENTPSKLRATAMDYALNLKFANVLYVTPNSLILKEPLEVFKTKLTEEVPVAVREYLTYYGDEEMMPHYSLYPVEKECYNRYGSTMLDPEVFLFNPTHLLSAANRAGLTGKSFRESTEHASAGSWIDWAMKAMNSHMGLPRRFNATAETHMPLDFKHIVRKKEMIAKADLIQFRPGYYPWELTVLPSEAMSTLPIDHYRVLMDGVSRHVSPEFRATVREQESMYKTLNEWWVKTRLPTQKLRGAMKEYAKEFDLKID